MSFFGDQSSKPRVIVVMPAYNAAKTLKITYEAIPHKVVDQIILVDDGSTDKTLDIARQLQLTVFVHTRNFGYGANQKTCYAEALKEEADIVVMLHPDYFGFLLDESFVVGYGLGAPDLGRNLPYIGALVR